MTPIAHWPLSGHANDSVGTLHGTPHGIRFTTGPSGASDTAAVFSGADSRIEVQDARTLQLGCSDFTLSAWVQCETPMRRAFGDILSKFDSELRCGLNLNVSGGSAAYGSNSDARHVHFGIDDGYLGPWQERGRPGTGNPLVSCLTVFEGNLYAGVSDANKLEDTAKVYRFDAESGWTDCGRLGDDLDSVSVMSMLVHNGHLYAGTGIWDWGRAQEARESDPPFALTRVFRYEGGITWRDLGQVGRGHRVFSMASFDGHLYAALDRGDARCFKLVEDEAGEASWEVCGHLDEKDNFMCLMPHDGVLYGASFFALYKYECGRTWTCLGRDPFGVSQIHSLQVYEGKLWIGSWPQGYVLRYEGDGVFTNTGRLGLATDKPGVAPINEINALGVHNGKLYAGVLPKGQVFRYESDGHWTLLGSLASRADWDPKVCPSWMRVLTLSTHAGELFACTGASQARTQDIDPDQTAGRVLSCQAGIVASHEHDLGNAWTHLAAIRSGREISLYVNGVLAQQSTAPPGHHFYLGNAAPLLIGSGPQSSFAGAISDVRLYDSALNSDQIQKLSTVSG